MRKKSRRDFLEASLVAAGSLAIAETRATASIVADKIVNPALGGGGFKLGLVSYNLAKDWNIPTIIKNCEETGFEAVELRTTHKHGVEPTLSKERRAETKNLFAGTKVKKKLAASGVDLDGADCRLATRTVQILPTVVDKLPPCTIRKQFRWYSQEGGAACKRCPAITTVSYDLSLEGRKLSGLPVIQETVVR